MAPELVLPFFDSPCSSLNHNEICHKTYEMCRMYATCAISVGPSFERVLRDNLIVASSLSKGITSKHTCNFQESIGNGRTRTRDLLHHKRDRIVYAICQCHFRLVISHNLQKQSWMPLSTTDETSFAVVCASFRCLTYRLAKGVWFCYPNFKIPWVNLTFRLTILWKKFVKNTDLNNTPHFRVVSKVR